MKTQLLAAIIALFVAVSASAQVQKVERPGIRNFSRVDATIGCGGAVESSALPALKKDGFVSVINLRLASEEGANVEQEGTAAAAAGLEVHAGHGLTYNTVKPIAQMAEIVELNIGHFLIGEAIFGGLSGAVRRMRLLMDEARDDVPRVGRSS